MTYLFVDSLSTNYVLAAVITYLCNLVSLMSLDDERALSCLDAGEYPQFVRPKELIEEDLSASRTLDLIGLCSLLIGLGSFLFL